MQKGTSGQVGVQVGRRPQPRMGCTVGKPDGATFARNCRVPATIHGAGERRQTQSVDASATIQRHALQRLRTM